MRVPYTRNWESKDRALQRGEARTGAGRIWKWEEKPPG